MSWTKEKSLALIREVGLVPIVRVPSAEDAFKAAEAIIAGGIGIAEITMTVPGALGVLEKVSERYGDKVLLGAGTILDVRKLPRGFAGGCRIHRDAVSEYRCYRDGAPLQQALFSRRVDPDRSGDRLAGRRRHGQDFPRWTRGWSQVY